MCQMALCVRFVTPAALRKVFLIDAGSMLYTKQRYETLAEKFLKQDTGEGRRLSQKNGEGCLKR